MNKNNGVNAFCDSNIESEILKDVKEKLDRRNQVSLYSCILTCSIQAGEKSLGKPKQDPRRKDTLLMQELGSPMVTHKIKITNP